MLTTCKVKKYHVGNEKNIIAFIGFSFFNGKQKVLSNKSSGFKLYFIEKIVFKGSLLLLYKSNYWRILMNENSLGLIKFSIGFHQHLFKIKNCILFGEFDTQFCWFLQKQYPVYFQ